MIRLVLMSALLLLSLLNVFRAPHKLLWYVSILTTEFCWIFFTIVCLLLLLHSGSNKYNTLINIIGLASLVLFSVPLIQAYRISTHLDKEISIAFKNNSLATGSPLRFSRILTGINARKVIPEKITYSNTNSLTLDFYASEADGIRPCVIVIHGGSWAGGNNKQLPELNSYLAKSGYNVISINYRLAPLYTYPAPIEDVAAAIKFLQENAGNLHLDASRIVLLGRSAGGQIALDAAYSIPDPCIRGVISYYGPTDMVWGYGYPANPLVLDSRGIMENYLGGTYNQVPQQYFKSSATEIVSPKSVPTLLIQGKNDPLVAYDHCNRLDKKLIQHGVEHFVLRLSWATHGFDYTLNGPAGQLSTYTTARFLKWAFQN